MSVALIHITRENSHSRGCSYYKGMKTFWRIYRGKMWSEERQPESKKFLWERESEREVYAHTSYTYKPPWDFPFTEQLNTSLDYP